MAAPWSIAIYVIGASKPHVQSVEIQNIDNTQLRLNPWCFNDSGHVHLEGV
jgi:hypothetical protein